MPNLICFFYPLNKVAIHSLSVSVSSVSVWIEMPRHVYILVLLLAGPGENTTVAIRLTILRNKEAPEKLKADTKLVL